MKGSLTRVLYFASDGSEAGSRDPLTATRRRAASAGAVLRLIRDGGARHARGAGAPDRARPLDGRPARRHAARARAGLRGRRQRLDRRPPADVARVQRRLGRRAVRRPRRHPLAARGQRPRRRAAGRGGRGPRHRARARSRCSAWSHERFARAAGARRARARADVRGIGIGVPGPVAFDRGAAGEPADHAGLGRLLDPGVVRRALRRAGARRQRRQHHGARRALDALARHASTCCSSRSAPASAAGSSPTGRSTAAPKGAAGDIGHIRARRARGRHLPLRQRRLPGGRRRRRRARPAAGRAGRSSAHAAATSCARARAATPAATQLVREAGRTLGEVLAGCVNFFNPAVIVIGGDIGEASTSSCWPACARSIFQRSLPLATERAARSSRAGSATAPA